MPDLSRTLLQTAMGLVTLGRPRLSIFIYHRVLKGRDWMRPGEPTAADFDWQMQLLKRHFNVLPLAVATRMLKRGTLPPASACVTFDDGYADNATVALPILQRHGIPATVFVAAGVLNGGRMWNDTVIETLRHCPRSELSLPGFPVPIYPLGGRISRRKAAYDIVRRCKYLPAEQRDDLATCLVEMSPPPSPVDNLMLTTAQLLTLHRQGVEIGGHTFSHPILARLTLNEAREEIMLGKSELERMIDQPLRFFAYPNGQFHRDFNSEHVALVKQANFDAAVTTSWGVSDQHTDSFQLARFTPWDKSSTRFLLRMVLNSRHVV